MFHYIRGTLAAIRQGFAVLDAGGVGFRLCVSDNTYQAISQKQNTEVKLFTYLSVREDGMELFGFFTEAELELFQLLITVSGVGPKAAMAILSVFTPEKFALAVCTDDKKAIAKANGIGPKTAARIILELHDKMANAGDFGGESGTQVVFPGELPTAGNSLAEAQEALLVLGYNRTEILGVLRGLDTTAMSTEELIRAALKKLMR